MLLNRFISCRSLALQLDNRACPRHLFQSLVVNEVGSIFRDFELAFLYVLAELPMAWSDLKRLCFWRVKDGVLNFGSK